MKKKRFLAMEKPLQKNGIQMSLDFILIGRFAISYGKTRK
ncbi:hypothetical protein JOC94_002406 [Bacillus thermophilus]|uniref:Uncharacterized protein n=1 Tax=Siminovitchia thermophila TaxID=1245522 RepID=A0ABS2R8E6_9BACI|nr:hypothetical protein [Siminovitchia thermophila]